jgi:hypothetical protein
MYPSASIVMANWFVFFVVNSYLGGDAIAGYAKAGHFFLCAHGGCTEVSSAVWHFSFWHTISAIGGIFLMFAETALFLNTGDIDFE